MGCNPTLSHGGQDGDNSVRQQHDLSCSRGCRQEKITGSGGRAFRRASGLSAPGGSHHEGYRAKVQVPNLGQD